MGRTNTPISTRTNIPTSTRTATNTLSTRIPISTLNSTRTAINTLSTRIPISTLSSTRTKTNILSTRSQINTLSSTSNRMITHTNRSRSATAAGQHSHISPEGVRVTTNWVADEQGFHPEEVSLSIPKLLIGIETSMLVSSLSSISTSS